MQALYYMRKGDPQSCRANLRKGKKKESVILNLPVVGHFTKDTSVRVA